MKIIALYSKVFYDNYQSTLQSLISILENRGYNVAIYSVFYSLIKDFITTAKDVIVFNSIEEIKNDVECLFSIGGDGTLLDTVSIVKDSGVPVLGINFGRMGFLSMVKKEFIESALFAFFHGEYELEQRSLLKIECDTEPFVGNDYALNEICFSRHEAYSLITPKVWVNETYLNRYWADGLIIATPTGSTAYSLACGGPILHPSTNSFVITPMASHNLSACSIVIPDDSVIKVLVECRENEFCMNVDSFSRHFNSGTMFTISKNSFNFNLIRIKEENFFKTIREKLNWGLDVRN